ncbi:hypothetical protein QQX09_09130 [Demequina sp. SYSU T00192]|uniref:LppM domain-containing protein n=1 Tax=Demequina litoralis TaxID=3051660 RepID=A0ABT8GBH5_9MICO|nr:hypothetical protein [Demequina sp. SYSU T00192]MDN4476014.1 hypothetical protein [Demequina sp. SYSU T00192]
MRRLGAALAVAAVALTGCVRVSTETTFGEDDTFSQHAVIAMTSQARMVLDQQLGQLADRLPEGVEAPDDTLDPGALLDPDAVLDQLAPLEDAHPGAVEVAPYEDEDGLEGVEISITDVPFDALDDAAGAAPLTGGTAVTRDGDEYVVELATGAASGLAAAGVSTDQLGLVSGAVDVAVSFTFPGLVRSASAGEVEGNTVILGLADLLAADDIRIVGGATTERDWGPLLRWGLVALGAVVVVGGAAALVVQDRRRRHRTHLPPPREGGEGGPGTLDREPPPAA